MRYDSQILLVLCGFIGSGKSSFALELESHFPNFKRCNQDDLGDRKQVERMAMQCLNEGHSVCIDRTNFDESQRAHWIRIAGEFPGVKIWCIHFDVSKEVCAARLSKRVDHPTITSLPLGLSVLNRVAYDFVHPSYAEGFDALLTLPESRISATYSRVEIQDILDELNKSSSLSSERPREWFFRGMGRGADVSRHYRRPYSHTDTQIASGFPMNQSRLYWGGQGRGSTSSGRMGQFMRPTEGMANGP